MKITPELSGQTKAIINLVFSAGAMLAGVNGAAQAISTMSPDEKEGFLRSQLIPLAEALDGGMREVFKFLLVLAHEMEIPDMEITELVENGIREQRKVVEDAHQEAFEKVTRELLANFQGPKN